MMKVDGPTFHQSLTKAGFEKIFIVKISEVDADPVDIPEKLQALLREFQDIFPDQLPDGMPSMRAVNFEMKMKPDAIPSSRAPFHLSKVEQEALEEFIQESCAKGGLKGQIHLGCRTSLVYQKDPITGKFLKRAEWLRSGNSKIPIRWVIDFRDVNLKSIIVKIPLPHPEDLFDRMAHCVVFTLIDLAQDYHQIVMMPSSRPFTALRTHKETYQWCVAPMGLAGMPGVWSRLMRVLFEKYEFVVIYIDDICIFSRFMEEHVTHVRIVLEVLRKEGLYACLSKCSFGKTQIEFLGHLVSKDGLSVDPRKTDAIVKYPTPRPARSCSAS